MCCRGFDITENSRPELKEKCLPNVTMVNCRVNVTADMKAWYIYNTAKARNYEGTFGYLSDVVIKDPTTNDENVRMEVFSKPVKTTNKVSI